MATPTPPTTPQKQSGLPRHNRSRIGVWMKMSPAVCAVLQQPGHDDEPQLDNEEKAVPVKDYFRIELDPEEELDRLSLYLGSGETGSSIGQNAGTNFPPDVRRALAERLWKYLDSVHEVSEGSTRARVLWPEGGKRQVQFRSESVPEGAKEHKPTPTMYAGDDPVVKETSDPVSVIEALAGFFETNKETLHAGTARFVAGKLCEFLTNPRLCVQLNHVLRMADMERSKEDGKGLEVERTGESKDLNNDNLAELETLRLELKTLQLNKTQANLDLAEAQKERDSFRLERDTALAALAIAESDLVAAKQTPPESNNVKKLIQAERELSAARTELLVSKAGLKQVQASLEKLQTDKKHVDLDAAEARKERDSLRLELNTAQAALAEANADLVSAKQAEEIASVEANKLKEALGLVQAELVSVREELLVSEAGRMQALDTLKLTHAERLTAEKERDDARNIADEELAKGREARVRLEQEVAQVRAELQQAEQARDQSLAELADADQALQSAATDRDAALNALETVRRESNSLGSELEKEKDTRNRLQAELDQAEQAKAQTLAQLNRALQSATSERSAALQSLRREAEQEHNDHLRTVAFLAAQIQILETKIAEQADAIKAHETRAAEMNAMHLKREKMLRDLRNAVAPAGVGIGSWTATVKAIESRITPYASGSIRGLAAASSFTFPSNTTPEPNLRSVRSYDDFRPALPTDTEPTDLEALQKLKKVVDQMNAALASLDKMSMRIPEGHVVALDRMGNGNLQTPQPLKRGWFGQMR